MLKFLEVICLWIFMLLFVSSSKDLQAQVSQIPHAHSHNDYTRKRPLFDALANGFQSIEVDVFFYKSKLVVSHTHTFLFWKKSLEELYIQPLDSIYHKQGGFFKKDSVQLILYVDTKNHNDSVCSNLLKIAEEYPHLFAHWKSGEMQWGPVKLLSTCYHLENDRLRFIQKNGTLSEIDKNIAPAIFPRVNASYRSQFNRKPRNRELEYWVELAHQYNRKIRFWRIGNKEKQWKKLIDAGVDWINIDKLEKYRNFYLENYQ